MLMFMLCFDDDNSDDHDGNSLQRLPRGRGDEGRRLQVGGRLRALLLVRPPDRGQGWGRRRALRHAQRTERMLRARHREAPRFCREEQSTRSCASDYHVKRSSTKPPRVTHTSLDVLPSRDRTHLRSRLLCRCSLSRHPIPAVRAEERCRKELSRENIVVEISVVSFLPELFAWYEAQGYRRKRSIPFPVPELVRDGCAFELQLMTKTIS